jgi:hypothetical protein
MGPAVVAPQLAPPPRPDVGTCALVDIDGVADELYALAPGEFIAARDERAAAARAAGDAGLAAAIKKLRKPTLTAWMANLVVRERRRDIDQLINVGAGLRAAQEQLAGDRLRELSRQRREVVTALTSAAQELARRAGASVSGAAADELAGTLEAASADPSAADELRAGRLTSALAYAGTGFGQPPSTVAAGGDRPRRAASGPRQPTRPSTDGRGGQRQSREAIRAAESAAKEATRRLAAAQKLAADATDALDKTRSSLEQAKAEAHRLEREARADEQRAAQADRQLREAEREEQLAQRRLTELRVDGT